MPAYTAFRESGGKMMSLTKAGNNAAALELVGPTEKHFRSARGFLRQAAGIAENVAGREYKNAVAQAESTTKLNTALLIAGLTLGIGLAFIIRNLAGQLGGEPGYAPRWCARWRQAIWRSTSAPRPLTTAACWRLFEGHGGQVVAGGLRSQQRRLGHHQCGRAVSATAQSLSQATSEQASGVEETSASVEQMTASISQNTENSKVTDAMASKAATEAAEGGEAVKVDRRGHEADRQEDRHRDDIAYQTNLLALNAAIEAAAPVSTARALPWWPLKCASWPSAARRPRDRRGGVQQC